jgi:hypothetical protein
MSRWSVEGFLASKRDDQACTFAATAQPISSSPSAGTRSHSGHKIVVDESVLMQVARTMGNAPLPFPITFEVTSPGAPSATHCSVLEFDDACNGRVFVSPLVFESLGVKPGAALKLRLRQLPLARRIVLQPESREFVKSVQNPQATLSHAFSALACATEGDVIAVTVSGREHRLVVAQALPQLAAAAPAAATGSGRGNSGRGGGGGGLTARPAARAAEEEEARPTFTAPAITIVTGRRRVPLPPPAPGAPPAAPEARTALSAVSLVDTDVEVEFLPAADASTGEGAGAVADEGAGPGAVSPGARSGNGGSEDAEAAVAAAGAINAGSLTAGESTLYRFKLPQGAAGLHVLLTVTAGDVDVYASGKHTAPTVTHSEWRHWPALTAPVQMPAATDPPTGYPRVTYPHTSMFAISRHDPAFPPTGWVYFAVTAHPAQPLTPGASPTGGGSYKLAFRGATEAEPSMIAALQKLKDARAAATAAAGGSASPVPAAAAAVPAAVPEGHTACSHCGAAVPAASAAMHAAQCRRLNFRCEDARCGRVIEARLRAEHGHCRDPACTEIIPPRLLGKHWALLHEPVSCRCGLTFAPRELAAHEAVDCALRLLPCPSCSASFTARELDAHAAACNARTRPCRVCGARVTGALMPSHLALEHGELADQHAAALHGPEPAAVAPALAGDSGIDDLLSDPRYVEFLSSSVAPASAAVAKGPAASAAVGAHDLMQALAQTSLNVVSGAAAAKPPAVTAPGFGGGGDGDDDDDWGAPPSACAYCGLTGLPYDALVDHMEVCAGAGGGDGGFGDDDF